MNKSNRKLVLLCSAVFSVIFSAINSPADEIGVAIGLNSSVYRFKTQEINNTKYQKTDILNPIEVIYQKEFIKFLGIHSALQYSKRSTSETIQHIGIDQYGNFVDYGKVKFENSMNYLSLEISPIFFHKFNHIFIDARSGVSGDFYLNEWLNQFGNKSVFHNKETSSFVLSFVSGIGLGYIIKDRFKIGIRSSISRTLTDIYKEQRLDADIFFLNFHNVIYFSFLI